MAHGVSDVLGEGSSVKMVHQKSQQQQQQQQLVQQQQSQQQPNVRKSVGVMGSRRIFAPAFKLKVLDSYRNDIDCRGNQRATARKYGIHRRQIQKWLQCEDNLRNSCAETGSAAATGSTVVVPTASVATTSPILAISSASKPDDGTVTEASVPAVTPAAVTAPALNLSLARLHGDELATQQGSPPLAPHPSHRGSPSTPPQYSPQQAASTTVLPLRVASLGGYPEYASGPQDQPNHQQRLRRELERRVHMPDMIHYSESRAGPERSYYMVNGESASREGTSEFVVSDAKVYQTLTSYRHHREHRYEIDAGCTPVNGHRGGTHRHEEDIVVNHRQRSPTYEHEKRQCDRGGYGDVDSSVEGKAYGMLLAPSMIKTERASPDSVATPGPYESAACSPVTPGGLLSPPFSHQATSTTTTINVPTTTTTAVATTTTTGTILAVSSSSSSSNSNSSSSSSSSNSSSSTTTNTISNSPTSVHFESPRRRASASPCLLHVHVHEHAHACPDSEKPIPCLRGQQEKESRETSARGCLKREEEVAASKQEEEEEEVAAEGEEEQEEIVTSEKVHQEEEEAEEMLNGAVVKEEMHLDEDESRLGREEDEDEDATTTVGASSVSCTDYQVPPAGSASLGSGPVSPTHDRDNLLYSSSSPSSPRGPGSSGRSSSSCSDSEMDPLDCSSSSQNSSNDLARRRSFSLRFKLDVLDAFHCDAGVAGNQRATARKFGINRRQVQKWLGQETELRGEIALRGNSRQRLGPIQDPTSSGESPVDLRTTGYVVGLHHGSQQDRIESDAYERSPMPPMAPLYCCDVGSSSSTSHHSYYHPTVEASAEIDLVRTCTLSCCVDGQGTQSYGTSCYQETGFRGSCCAESQGRLYCYSPREYDTPSNPAESSELISSPLKRQHCTLSCCYDPAASPKRLCLDPEERSSSCQKTPPQETPLCLVKPKRVCDSSPSRTEPVTSTVPTPPASAAAPPPPLPSSKKDAILFKPYLDNPVSKPSKEPVIQRGLSPISTQIMNNNNCQSICNLNEDSRGHDYALELSLRVPVSWRAHPSPYAEFPQVRSAFVRYPTSPHYT